jgi:hypothetical protein
MPEDYGGSPLGGAFSDWYCPTCADKLAVHPAHLVWHIRTYRGPRERDRLYALPVHVVVGGVYVPALDWIAGAQGQDYLERAQGLDIPDLWALPV